METKGIRIYSIVKRRCDNCLTLKKLLKDEGMEYEIIDIESASAMTELFHRGVFARSVPILQIGDKFYTNILTKEQLRNVLKSNETISDVKTEIVNDVTTDIVVGIKT